MHSDGSRRRSRWVMRVMEWDEPRAPYPNLWRDGMPQHVLAYDTVVRRLRLGDLIAIYQPPSTRHPQRSERYVGIARIRGLRVADAPGHSWIDLETAHRFDPPLAGKRGPRRVFLCCDPGWSEPEVALFRELFDAAVAAGWEPSCDEREGEGEEPALRDEAASSRSVARRARPRTDGEPAAAPPPGVASPAPQVAVAPPTGVTARSDPAAPPPGRPAPAAGERSFAGADYSGNMRDPREKTWLAVVTLVGEALHVARLTATGRSGLEAALRDPDPALMQVEAIGLGFPFGLPLPFAESLLGGPFPAEGWWALARRLERVSWPDYLSALHEFRDARGELRRLTDERADALSPLHRVDPDMGSRCFHGIRMIAEDRSRYAIRPFESAQGRLLIEVSPGCAVRRMGAPAGTSRDIVERLGRMPFLPLQIDEPFLRRCLERRDALDAVIAARCAAVALSTEETARSPERLAPDGADRVRREGWIYGLEEKV